MLVILNDLIMDFFIFSAQKYGTASIYFAYRLLPAGIKQERPEAKE